MPVRRIEVIEAPIEPADQRSMDVIVGVFAIILGLLPIALVLGYRFLPYR